MGAWSLPASLSIVALSCQRSVYVPTRRMVGAESPLQRILIFGIHLSETFSRDSDITEGKTDKEYILIGVTQNANLFNITSYGNPKDTRLLIYILELLFQNNRVALD